MDDSSPLVNKTYLLEKFPGKGGWTFARIPEVLQNPHQPFGWVTVRGSIDGYSLNQYKLMPMGDGQLFLPVRAAIRKQIGKEAGDTVYVILYADDSPLALPDDVAVCLADEPAAQRAFTALKKTEQKAYIDWIVAAKTDTTQVTRIAAMIDRVQRGLRLHDPDPDK